MEFKYGTSVTPDDSNDLSATPTKAVLVGSGGDIAVTLEAMADGENVVLKGLNAGEIYPIKTKRIFSTNTTAV